MAIGAGTARFVALKAGSVDATMLTPPANFMAQEAGFRELVSFIEQDLVEVQGSIFMRQESIKSDPVLAEKLVRATLKGLLYFRSNRSGSVAALARFLKSKPDLAARLYDLILPGTTRDGTINDALQKRSVESVVERLAIKDPPPLEKIYNFAIARKTAEELSAKNVAALTVFARHSRAFRSHGENSCFDAHRPVLPGGGTVFIFRVRWSRRRRKTHLRVLVHQSGHGRRLDGEGSKDI